MTKYKTKVDIVYESILEDLMKGKYKTGDKLVISAIAKENNISDIPVREAIRRLASEGWVVLSANKGATVYGFSESRLREIFEIKAVLEGYATRQACDILTEEDYKDLEDINKQLAVAFKENDGKKCGQLNRAFHLRMYRDINEKELLGMIENLWVKYRLTIRVFSLDPEHVVDSVKDHQEIMKLAKAKDYEGVEHKVREHKMRAGQCIIDELNKQHKEV